MPRTERRPNELRPLSIETDALGAAPGRVLTRMGGTVVLCTASVSDDVPPWLAGRGKGWVTAEYNMLPGSTSPRKPRDRGPKVDGRTTEIQRLIGRSLRAVVDLQALGERSITVDCDVLQADGGTRTTSITGGFVALVEALRTLPDFATGKLLPLTDSVAAVSVGLVDDEPLLDLDYSEDFAAAVDMNVVMTGSGKFCDVQATGEEATFDRQQFDRLLTLAEDGARLITVAQQSALGKKWQA